MTFGPTFSLIEIIALTTLRASFLSSYALLITTTSVPLGNSSSPVNGSLMTAIPFDDTTGAVTSDDSGDISLVSNSMTSPITCMRRFPSSTDMYMGSSQVPSMTFITQGVVTEDSPLLYSHILPLWERAMTSSMSNRNQSM